MNEEVGTAVERAIVVLRTGGVVAYPTDTLYGLAVDPRSPEAVARLFALKGREIGHAIPLIAADEGQAREAGELNQAAARLASAFWPGPLSIIVPATARVRSEVTAVDGSVAIRVPRCDTARRLAAGLGFCITATSANLTGHPATASVATVRRTVGGLVDFVLDDGDSPGGSPSTIVDVREAVPRLVRGGAVPWDRVLESLQ